MSTAGTSPGGTRAPHLRQVLGAAAVSAGLRLRESIVPATLSQEEALAAATSWGIRPDGDRGPRAGGGTVVVLVDGLGLENLRARKGHAPTLRSWLSSAEANAPGPEARTCLPSTTAAALTTLGTGALPGTTGMVGYSVLNPLLSRERLAGREPSREDQLSLISWEGHNLDPRAWQDVPTIFERLERDPGRSHRTDGQSAPLAVSIGPARFAGSGLTLAGLRGAAHRGADRMEDRPALAARALAQGVALVYLYVGELDHAGHAHGWRSAQWLTQLERLDGMLAELARRVPRGTRILLTADHGMVDTEAAHRVDLSADPVLARDVVAVAGEPRFTHLYVTGSDPEVAAETAARWRERLGDRALWVGTRDEAHTLLGPLSERARSVVGDVVVAMADAWVLVDPRVHSPEAIAMPGVHGSLTVQETTIPLLLTRA
ncbi:MULTISPECIES: alkaline phosphatase family protein [Actinomyces]|uniref:Alkaline phosphatase family protein n=1 Tax=Actinomyces respiraculi TaxID=2744574 RepID=A0A7T0LIU0_9ACTO|nr:MULTISPECIES: alkaline phosphatase family protein [Actinomyces]QPL04534.1 alkaline phosphatase family protein [Actinomyces respiraculi]